MEQRHVGARGASRCKFAVGVRVDDWWRVWRCASYERSDYLDLFLSALRRWGAAALLLFAFNAVPRALTERLRLTSRWLRACG